MLLIATVHRNAVRNELLTPSFYNIYIGHQKIYFEYTNFNILKFSGPDKIDLSSRLWKINPSNYVVIP